MRGVSGATRRARSRDLQADGEGVAALIVCSIFANEGLPDIPAGFMPRAAAKVREAGGLVIADEVQAGYARTGRWWGYEVTGFTPDIVVTGKPMGNGLPLAATAASRALVETFRAQDALLQHLRLVARCRRRSAWRCWTRSSTRDLRGNVATRRRRAEGGAEPAQGRAATRSATCAATACSSASRWSGRRTARRTPTSPSG